MARTATMAILTVESGLTRYFEQIRRFPLLERQDEYMFAKRWREHGDHEAAHRLVTSHLRLVAKIAMGYRGYGLPISEVISEGNVGLMQAVNRFEPEKGFRLATYAMWWIKAAIKALGEALSVLNDRERRIFEARRLADDPIILDDLASEFDISRERVRQIEVCAFEKVQRAVKNRVAATETWAPLTVH